MNESTIFKKLSDYFSPTHLEVINESHKHKGHAQSPNSGNSHFLIIITSDKLQGMSRLAGQRKIYKVLEKEMKNQIHALQIKIVY